MKTTALIMAGGRGERFWPRSRMSLPKQFLSLTDDGRTMIQLTIDRISSLVDLEDVYIATNTRYKELVTEQLPGLPEENILCEPVGRNTAPCIALAAVHIARKYEDAIMLVLPSDHLVHSVETFTQTLQDAVSVASTGSNLVTLGIPPAYAETGYGYIHYRQQSPLGKAYAVAQFVEKPNRETAEKYLAAGDYLWNSGMFIWKVSSILENMHTHMPELYNGIQVIREAIGTPRENAVLTETFPNLPSESIDYGIMEKASDIYIIPGNFGWDDVGSWLAMERIRQTDDNDNVIAGNVLPVNSKHCILESSGKLIAAVGLKDLIVIDTEDAILICDKEHSEDIKKVLAELRATKQDKYI